MTLIIFWDGVVSMLRICSPEQMTELTGETVATDYSGEIGRIAESAAAPPWTKYHLSSGAVEEMNNKVNSAKFRRIVFLRGVPKACYCCFRFAEPAASFSSLFA